MTTAEAKAVPVFGEITLEDMRKNELLAAEVMKRVKEVCAHSKGRYTVTEIADGLTRGAYTIWGVLLPPSDLKAIIVTAANNAVLDVVLAGPVVEDFAPFLPRLYGEARTKRCTRMRLIGPGFFQKHLPEGWRPSVTVYERDLT